LLSENRKASLIILIIVLFGVYCFVFGQSGVLERMVLVQEKSLIDEEILGVERENQRLLALYDSYATGAAFSSTAESLGFILPGQKVIVFAPKRAKLSEKTEILAKKSLPQVPITRHLRTLWVLLSIFIVVLYLVHFRPEKSDR